MADVMFASSTCWVEEGLYLRRGMVFAADDPLVLSRPELFTADPSEFLARPAPARPVVEQATAAPGELRRGPGRPRKDGSGPFQSFDRDGVG